MIDQPSSKIRALILSLDRALVSKSGEGDTLKRFQAYKKTCQSLTVIVPTDKKSSEKTVKGVRIIPADGLNNYFAYWQIYRLAKKICCQESIDLVVTNDAVLGAIAIWLKRKFPIKVQINILGLEIISKHWLRERFQNIFLKWIQEWAIRRADGFRVDNTKTKKLLMTDYGVDPQKIVVIPVTPSKKSQERFLKASEDKRLKEEIVGKNNKMVLSVGSLVKAKDFITLVNTTKLAAKAYPKAVFVIAGEGPERDGIEKEIEKRDLKDKVRLLGSIDYSKLPSIFASADIFVISSTHEGFPRALMEAALSGRPIVTTAVDGASDLIENNKSGLVVPVRRPKDMAKAIMRLLKDPQLANKLGERARSKAKALLSFTESVKLITNSWRELTDG